MIWPSTLSNLPISFTASYSMYVNPLFLQDFSCGFLNQFLKPIAACVGFSHMLLVGKFSVFPTTSGLSLALLSIPILPAVEPKMELESPSFSSWGSEVCFHFFADYEPSSFYPGLNPQPSALSPGSQRQFYPDISTILISNMSKMAFCLLKVFLNITLPIPTSTIPTFFLYLC